MWFVRKSTYEQSERNRLAYKKAEMAVRREVGELRGCYNDRGKKLAELGTKITKLELDLNTARDRLANASVELVDKMKNSSTCPCKPCKTPAKRDAKGRFAKPNSGK